MSLVIPLLLQALASGIASVGFSLLFGAPARCFPYCGLIGAVGWTAYLILEMTAAPTLATLAATILVVLLSRWYAVRGQCPATIFLTSAMVPLVPRRGLYWATYYAVNGELELAMDTGFEAFKMVVAIVLGIVLVLELPQRWFRAARRKPRQEG